MHALCTIVTSKLDNIQNILEYYQDDAWDYASIGGRYSNIIPVGKKCKDIHSGCAWPDIGPNAFPYLERMEANENCKYVNVSRIRNINQEECMRIEEHGGLSPWNPYTLILCHEDGGFEWVDWEELPQDVKAVYRTFLNDTRRKSWWMVIIDYHY